MISESIITAADLRAQFPILANEMNGKPLVFLDSAASSQKPKVVIDSISNYYETTHANVHRGVYKLSQQATDAFEKGRTIVKNFINAPSEEEVIFTKGATEGINLVASCFGRKFLNEGDEVLISAMEHHANIVPWQLICEERKAVLKVIPITDDGELIMEEYKNLLNERTKIVAVSHVSNTLGTINPVKEIIQIAHALNIPVLVDGCQAAPHLPIDVQSLDADFYVFSGHKVYGPTGIGVLYGKKEWLEAMPPYHGGGDMIETVTFEKTTFNKLPHKYEAGTPHVAGVVGLGTALEYIQEIGFDYIIEHEQQLLQMASEQLQDIPGLRIIGEAKHKVGVISFVVEGTHPYDIGALLDKQGIAVRTGHHCTQPLMQRFEVPGTIRASFGVYTDQGDIEALIKGVKKALSMLL
jgi:cysteine desulfurase / selenocysteine lyase